MSATRAPAWSGLGKRRRTRSGVAATLDAAWTIFLKDLRIEARRRETAIVMTVFAVLVLVVFNFAIDLQVGDPAAVAPGVFWTTILFAGILGFGRTFAVERHEGSLDGLLLAPVDRTAIYLAKLLTSFSQLLVLQVVVIPVFGLMYNQPVFRVDLWLGVFVSTLAFAVVGTLFAALTAHARAREALLPVLLLPTAVPVIIGSVQLTSSALSGGGDALLWLALVTIFCVIYLALALALFPFIMEE